MSLDYVMGRATAEYQRLRSQARALEPVTRRVLERVGVGGGMRCVDVGCGAGDVHPATTVA
jgi:ubiquinone/menaquinone biosynthesis C-methylase UbiE